MLTVGLSIGDALLDETELSAMIAAGIGAVELSYGDHRKYEGYDFPRAKVAAASCGMQIWSMHLPFGPFTDLDPASLDGEKRAFTLRLWTELIKRGADIGIDKFVAHPSAEPNAPHERAEKLKVAADLFHTLAERAAACGAVIALEDLPRTCLGNCSDELLYLLSVNENLRVCYDTNHLLNEDNVEFIKKMGSKIITLHVSDYDFKNERHWLPGEGENDWSAIYRTLQEVGYNGVWLYELGLTPPATICRRPLTYADFVRNAHEIMNGLAPTPIGQRIADLAGWQ